MIDAIAEIDPFLPRTLVSFGDMIRFVFDEYVQASSALMAYQQQYHDAASRDPHGTLTDKQIIAVFKANEHIRPLFKKLKMTSSEDAAENVSIALDWNVPIPYLKIATALEMLCRTMDSEMNDKNFAFIPPDKVPLFEREQLFGAAVFTKMPEAQYDIKEAGNCLAAGANTAAVFHLMRAAEFGLRRLVKKLKLKGKKPITEQTWGQILNAVEAALDILDATARTPRQKAKREYYYGIVMELNAFKDIWRNNVMHTKKSFTETESHTALIHVKGFLQRLVQVQ